MKIKHFMLLIFSLLLYSTISVAKPTVEGNTISWPNDGWYQVQEAGTYKEVCAGGRSCEVSPGTYIVINHSTGERFNNIKVSAGTGGGGTPTDTVVVTGNVISWPDNGWYQVQEAGTYKEVCHGGLSCEVSPGTYIVINHSTGERFNNIEVSGGAGGGGTPSNPIIVTGNVISWPDDGWYQVQTADTHTAVCGGGRSCEVAAGEYVVINHTIGQRYTGIVVSGSGGSIDSPQDIHAIWKAGNLTVSWAAVTEATSYNIYISDQPDVVVGASGVTQHTSQGLSVTLTGVVIGGTYYIAVSAASNGQESGSSQEINTKLQEPAMELIPSGTFTMGCISHRDGLVPGFDYSGGCNVDENATRNVLAESFKLSKTEVTFNQWAACVDAGGCNGYQPSDEGWGKGDRPVINITWANAKAYIAWLRESTGKSYRLPSEAEWEYASRGGSNTTAYSLNGGSQWVGANQANCDVDCEDNFTYTAPVGSFAPNQYGLYDMHGNVGEWVEDCWHRSYIGAPTTAIVWAIDNEECSLHPARGGAWRDGAPALRSASRGASYLSNNYTGFRVALDLQE